MQFSCHVWEGCAKDIGYTVDVDEAEVVNRLLAWEICGEGLTRDEHADRGGNRFGKLCGSWRESLFATVASTPRSRTRVGRGRVARVYCASSSDTGVLGGGGVGIFVKNDIVFKTLSQYSVFHERIFESLFIEVVNENKQKVVIGSVYRPGTKYPGL